MEISSHYYALLAMCRISGLDKGKSHKIAYASQFVDDAHINYLFVESISDDETLFEKNKDDTICLKNIATCHSYFKIKTYNFSAMIYNTCAFHFIPGCKGKNFTEKLICRENSEVIRNILDNNLNSTPEKFGLLLHIYADTFAHQGFSGLLSKKNNIENLKPINGTLYIQSTYYLNYYLKKLWSTTRKLINKNDAYRKLKDFIPAYGHGQAEHYPDTPYLIWSYNYNNETHENDSVEEIKVNNQERYYRAFLNIKTYLSKYIESNKFKCENFSNQITDDFFYILSKKTTKKKKIKLWQNFLYEHNLFDKKDKELIYDENYWLSEVFKDFSKEKYHARVVNNAKLVDMYRDTSWYNFVKGVKEYKLELVKELEKNDLILPK